VALFLVGGLRRQLLQQRLRFLQIARVETLREPPVHRRQQFARLLHLALVAPEACEALREPISVLLALPRNGDRL
jgi:hypothetical protein